MNQQPFDLSIVIPAYHEAHRIGQSLDELAQFLKQEPSLKNVRVEVVVVAADAPDDTHQKVEAHTAQFAHLRLLRPGSRVGKGRDVRYGMLQASGKAIIFMDADLATPLKYLPVFYQQFQAGYDVVIATRNLRKHHPNVLRRLLSNCGNWIFRLASGIWVEDSQCGFKLFSKQAAELCFSKLTILGWGFDMEVLAIAKANHLRLATHRIDDWRSVPEGTFTGSIVRNSLVSLGELLYILWNRVRRTYTK